MSASVSERVRFARFAVAGGIAAAVNIASRWVFSLALIYELAVACAYLAGMTTAFLLNRAYVFERPESGVAGQFIRFATVNAVAFAQVWIVSVGLARLAFPAMGWTWHAETIAHTIGVLSPIATSYFGHKHFSFRA
jgi:putative flippase GtrA